MDTAAIVDPATLFKTLDGNDAFHGGTYKYRKGVWTRGIPDPVPCKSGWHLARGAQVLGWLSPTLWTAEADPAWPIIEHDDKVVCGRVRVVEKVDGWTDRTARLFAADCAEAALLGERALGREPDERLWAAVDVARRYAEGEASETERDAAWAAAWATAREAAGWSATWYAAGYAARSAARAARDAATAAAGDATRAAARYAGAAARDAAGSAARDAATAAMYARLCAYLNGDPIPPVEPLY